MIGLLLRCYPARWRARYGEEFAALLAERTLGPFDVADVLLGALDARLHRRGLGSADEALSGPDMTIRTGGTAAIAGGVLWILVCFLSATSSEGGAVAMALILLATVVLLVALTGLSAFQARRYPRLVWAAFLVPAMGALVSIVGVVAMAVLGDRPFPGADSPWVIWMLGTVGLLIGSGLFAIATWRVDTLPRSGALILAVGAVAVIPALAGGIGGLLPEDIGRVVSVLAMSAFGGGWVVLGIGALRRDRATPVTPPRPG